MNPILFFIAFLGVFILLNMYISKRLIAKLDLSDKTKFILRAFLVLNLFGMIGYMLGRYYIDIPNWLYFLFSIPIGVLFLLFCTAIIYDISRLILHYTPVSDERRKFFKKSLDVSSLAVASSLSARSMYEAKFVQHEKVPVKIKNLKQEYRVVQLSDVHIGGLIDAAYIKNIVDRVNAMRADLVVITGDLVDIDVNKIQAPLDELAKLSSKYGTYFVSGNHEFFHGVDKIMDALRERGIRVLENENVYIGDKDRGFHLAGVHDIFGYRVEHHEPNLDAALRNVTSEPIVLLAHQPKYIEEVSGVDLMLSGHTHGGQLYPFRFLVKLQQPYISGLHQHNKDLQIYVSKGTGFWGPPMRLGASAEITELLLTPSES